MSVAAQSDEPEMCDNHVFPDTADATRLAAVSGSRGPELYGAGISPEGDLKNGRSARTRGMIRAAVIAATRMPTVWLLWSATAP